MKLLRIALLLCGLPVAAGAVADPLSSAIQDRVERLMIESDYTIRGVTILAREPIAEFYAARQYQPAWKTRQKMAQLLELSEFAYSEGLDPTDYPLEAARALVPAGDGLPEDVATRADLELLATESLIRMGYQLRYGKVNPNGLFPAWNFRRELEPGTERSRTIENAIAAPSLVGFLDNWIKRGAIYTNQKRGLAQYRSIQKAGGWEPVPAGATLHEGDNDPRVVALRRRLLATGDLTEPDVDSETLDANVQQAVVRFQKRHGLGADGVVGAATYEALNVTVEHRIDQLRASLERMRWVLDEVREVTDKVVVVNVASAEVAVLQEPSGTAIFRSRAQVGKPYRQTPIFKGNIQYLQVNPTWTVPPTILRNDVLPKLKQDADGYLTSKHMDLLDQQGNRVDHMKLDWSAIGPGNFPYIVRQRPGPWNALGQVKFIFPNPHFVFLHDTPSRALFDRPDRTFSSGCIRVERPFELAEIVLDDSAWDQASLEALLKEESPRNISLQTDMPVFILYWTAMVDADGTTRFFKDVYQRDAKLLAAMNKAPVLELATSIGDRPYTYSLAGRLR